MQAEEVVSMPCLDLRILMATYRLSTDPNLLAPIASLEAAVDFRHPLQSQSAVLVKAAKQTTNN